MRRFANQHVLVVGATSRIGAAIVRVLAHEGARLTLSGRSDRQLAALRGSLAVEAPFLACDLRDVAAREVLLKDGARRHGRFNALVYVAGYHRLMPLGPGYSAGLAEHLALNVEAPLDLVRGFVARAVSDESEQRSITMIASVAHRLGEPALSAYSASKAALVAGARGLAVELARKNVRVNTVSPGWVLGDAAARTESAIPEAALEKVIASYPLGFGAPDDVAQGVAWLTSSAARWVTGTDLVIDGGRSCV